MLVNNIILTISIYDIVKPLGMRCRPYANSVRDVKYHKLCRWLLWDLSNQLWCQIIEDINLRPSYFSKPFMLDK
jgi:hypothetical protein